MKNYIRINYNYKLPDWKKQINIKAISYRVVSEQRSIGFTILKPQYPMNCFLNYFRGKGKVFCKETKFCIHTYQYSLIFQYSETRKPGKIKISFLKNQRCHEIIMSNKRA